MRLTYPTRRVTSAELAIIIPYPTNASGIIVSLKNRKFFPTLFVNTTDFQLVLILSRLVREHGIMAHIP